MKRIVKFLYTILKSRRLRVIKKILNPEGIILDVGCQDLYFYNHLKSKHEITLVDYYSKNKDIQKEDIQHLSYEDNSFDIVLAQEVLEHVLNPIQAILELKRVVKKQLIITIPNEPFFSLFRCLIWEKQHLWALTPKILKYYLGTPIYEKKIILKRYYVGVWNYV